MKNIYKKIGSYLILTIASICFLVPFYLMICKASGGNIALSKGPVIPGTELWKNISYILFQTEFLKSMWFTLRYTIVQTLLTLLVCGLAGFAVEIYHDKYKDILFKVVLFAMMISITPLMVPLFKMYTKWGIIDTMWGVMAPFLASPLIIMIFRQNSRGFPYELVEAARLDGASELGIFLSNLLTMYEKYIFLWHDYRILKCMEFLSVATPCHVQRSENTYDSISYAWYERRQHDACSSEHGSFFSHIFHFPEILCRRNEWCIEIKCDT